MTKKIFLMAITSVLLLLTACTQKDEPVVTTENTVTQQTIKPEVKLTDKYASFDLVADLSALSNNQKQMLSLMIDVSVIMDDLFWQQSYGSKNELLSQVSDPDLKKFATINYGPWDRLDGDKAFVTSFSEKSLGANFYPANMTKQEFENSSASNLKDLYTLVERNDSGELIAVTYHKKYAKALEQAAQLIKQAAELAEDEGFKKYLQLRATALLTDEFKTSDLAWMDMKNNSIDFIVGPIENYEDQLFGYKTAYESYVLLKDKAWSKKLTKFASFLPQLQKELPVDAVYKQETPGTGSDLNAYDAIYYAGHSNAGSKTIAINLPNDESVQLEKGTRRLQLKNVMRAKFEKILQPISTHLVNPEQHRHITFNAFFTNTMFHEVAHGLGVKNTINDKGTVRTALKQFASALEEGKADILGLYMVEKLHKLDELDGDIMDYYVTFMAGIFRSARFGSSSAHGVANMLRFNYFAEHGAFNFDSQTGHYSVNPKSMSLAIESLSRKILTLQGDGNFEAVDEWFTEKGNISPQLKASLAKINQAGIPVDIDFKQGKQILGL
ncbi:MAG: Zn-dependent hydrolase [Proteobacteria bacterium]|nr:Zn-dependent hydrolase [Pseudomonadota bacterium]